MRNFLILLLLALVSCGGNTPEPTPETFTIQITPGAALLTKTGETKALTAKVLNSSGNAVDKAITWTSSNPETVQISSDGVITALKDLGSSQITASVGEVKSLPATALIAQPVDGAVLVSDAQVLSTAQESIPEQRPIIGSQYKITLSNDAAPNVGAILIGTGGAPVIGKVVSVTPLSNGIEVVLERRPVTELFNRLSVNLQGLLNDVKPNFTGLTKPTTVQQLPDGRTRMTYTPNKSLIAPRAASQPFKVGPFTCIAKAESSLSPQEIKVELKNTLNFDFVLDTGLFGVNQFRVKADGSLSASITGGVVLAAQGKVELACEDTVFRFPIPVTGPVAFLLGPTVPIGLKFAAEGVMKVTALEVSLTGELKEALTVGVDYNPQAGFTNLTSVTSEKKLSPKLVTPGDPQLEVTAKVSFQATAGIGFGNAIASLTVIQLAMGPALSGSFKTAVQQALDRTGLPSSYDLKIEETAGAGPDLKDALELIFSNTTASILSRVNLSIAREVAIASSPTAEGAITADKESFNTGETVKFKVTLDPANLTLIPLVYNVENIQIYHKDNTGVFNSIVTKIAVDGQKNFELEWQATEAGKVENGNFVAFVQTKLSPGLLLELAEVTTVAGCVPKATEKYCIKIFDIDFPTAINDKEQLLGINNSLTGLNVWVLWKNNQRIDLETNFIPTGINNAGQIIGQDFPSGVSKVWQDGTFVTLEKPSEDRQYPTGINDKGQVIAYTIGNIGTGNSTFEGGFIWDGLISKPKFLKDKFLEPISINNNGKVVGLLSYPPTNSDFSSKDTVLWSPNSLIALPRINDGGDLPYVAISIDINDSDQILLKKEKFIRGTGDNSNTSTIFTYIWASNNYTKIDSPSGSSKDTSGKSLNNAGQIVGNYLDINNKLRSFIWQDGTATDLTSLIDPTLKIIITEAHDINNKGQIVTSCIVPNSPKPRDTCLLTPAQ
jgi:hypothetical protein